MGENTLPYMTEKTCSYLFLLGFNYNSHGYFLLILSFILKSSQQNKILIFLVVCKIGLTGFLLLSQTVTQLILIICKFHIYKFAYSIKFTCNPEINTRGALELFAGMLRTVNNPEFPTCTVPADNEQGNPPPSCFRCHSVNKCPLEYSLCNIFTFLCFWGVILLYTMPPSKLLKCGLMFLSTNRL